MQGRVVGVIQSGVSLLGEMSLLPQASYLVWQKNGRNQLVQSLDGLYALRRWSHSDGAPLTLHVRPNGMGTGDKHDGLIVRCSKKTNDAKRAL